MSEKFSIKVKIAERQYTLNVEEKYVEQYNKTAKKINEHIEFLKGKYQQSRDTIDFLSMTALMIGALNSNNEIDKETFKFIEDVRDITDDLDEYLQKKLKSSLT